MIFLSLELSTPRASIALLDDDRVLAEAGWEEAQARHQRVFVETPRLLESAGLNWGDVDAFVVGRGPGAFSGIRIGLMAAQMFALPLGKPVQAVSTAEALAMETGAECVLVCGDARRGMFWYGLRAKDRIEAWHLCRTADWSEVLTTLQPERIVTSQWERTQPLRDAAGLAGWKDGDRFPTAAGVARLAQRGGTPHPLTPIYLHPAV